MRIIFEQGEENEEYYDIQTLEELWTLLDGYGSSAPDEVMDVRAERDNQGLAEEKILTCKYHWIDPDYM